MKIRSNRTLAILLLVVGLLLFVTGFLSDAARVNLFSGPIVAILGGLMLFQPAIVISHYDLKMKSPIGMTYGTYPIRFAGDLAIHDNKLWHVPTNRKITALGWTTHKPDVDRLQQLIEGAQGTVPHGASPHDVRFPEQPDPYLGGQPHSGVPLNPGSMDTPTPHSQYMPETQQDPDEYQRPQ